MSERLESCFAALRRKSAKALVVYLTANDPDADTALACADACVRAGADVLEVGVPFSDPVADGPVIQRAMQRALAAGGGLGGALTLVEKLRARHAAVPIVLFGYANPFLARGFDQTCGAAQAAGADGVLLVDIPSEENASLRATAAEHGLAWISLVAPTTGRERTHTIARCAQGFIYLVSMTGVTGGALQDLSAVERSARWVREVSEVPLMVGFGVRDAATAVRVAAHGDGVVVGSAVIQALQEGGAARVAALVGELRKGLDHA